MERLLPALDGLPPVYLVGGAVRDLLLGAAVGRRRPRGRGRRAAHRARARRPARRRRGRRTSASARRRCAPATLAFDIAATRTRDLSRAGRAARRRARRADRGPRPARLHDQRDGGRAPGRRARPPARPARRLRRPGRARRFACCTTAASSTTRRGCCAPSGTRCGSTSGWTSRPRSSRARRSRRDALATVSGPRIRDELLDLLRRARRAAWRRAARRARAARGARRRPERRRRAGGLGQARRG